MLAPYTIALVPKLDLEPSGYQTELPAKRIGASLHSYPNKASESYVSVVLYPILGRHYFLSNSRMALIQLKTSLTVAGFCSPSSRLHKEIKRQSKIKKRFKGRRRSESGSESNTFAFELESISIRWSFVLGSQNN